MKEKLRVYINRKFVMYPKTNAILALKKELFSMMCDRYEDCMEKGMTKNASYREALTFMKGYRSAVREVQPGNSADAIRKKLVGSMIFMAFYFIVLTAVYLFFSMIVLKSYSTTWLIMVFGTCAFLVYFSANLINYARIFALPWLKRIAILALYLSLIPLLYVFPSLHFSVLSGINIWGSLWAVIPLILFALGVTDLAIFGRGMNRVLFWLELAGTGLLFVTFLYVLISLIFQAWGIAWILYVLYMAAAAMVAYVEVKKQDRVETKM